MPQNSFQVVYFCFPINFTIYPEMKWSCFLRLLNPSVCAHWWFPCFVPEDGTRLLFPSLLLRLLMTMFTVPNFHLLPPTLTLPPALLKHWGASANASSVQMKSGLSLRYQSSVGLIKGFCCEVLTVALDVSSALCRPPPCWLLNTMCCLLLLARHHVEADYHMSYLASAPSSAPPPFHHMVQVIVHQRRWCK